MKVITWLYIMVFCIIVSCKGGETDCKDSFQKFGMIDCIESSAQPSDQSKQNLCLASLALYASCKNKK